MTKPKTVTLDDLVPLADIAVLLGKPERWVTDVAARSEALELSVVQVGKVPHVTVGDFALWSWGIGL